MKKYIKLLRPQHWLKNALILLPFVCGKELFNWELWLKVIPAFFAFCFLSSTIYIINDIRDVDKDRLHPTKCNRPIACGAIPIKVAIIIAAFLLCAAAGLNVVTFSSWWSWLILGLYFVLNLAYSFGLKNIAIVDIAILASGFFLRVLYGSVVTGIIISNWMYLTVIALSFYLGLGKRRNELIKNKDGETRGVLKFYNHNFLDKFMYLCLAVAVVFYSLWTVDASTIERLGNRLLWSVPFVIILLMKYSLTIEGNSDGDPVNVILKDKILLVMAFLSIVGFGLLIYL